MPRILIIDDDPEVCRTMQSLARRMRIESDAEVSIAAGLRAVRAGNYDAVFLDVRLPDGNGLSAIPEIKNLPDAPEVIILTGLGDPDGAEMAISSGAWDYLVKPSPIKKTMLTLERAIKYRAGKRTTATPVALQLDDVIGRTKVMRDCYDIVATAAVSEAGVLIVGETGTGKELFARTIHANSGRSSGPFVAVDCASLTESLLEATLFGQRKGAFTGADADRDGLVTKACGGTLFLDEIGELPTSAQKSFLRVLQEKRFRPVGSTTEVSSDFRLISATNRDLESMVAAGNFRQDLYYRIKTVTLALPPLRERREDIKNLSLYWVNRLSESYQTPPKGFGSDFFEALETYDWPGNVRELFNTLERAFVTAGQERTLYAMHLPQDLRIKVAKANLSRAGERREAAPSAPEGQGPATMTQGLSLGEFKDVMEKRYLEELFAREGGDIRRMLEASGLSRSHFYALLKKHGLSSEAGRGTEVPE